MDRMCVRDKKRLKEEGFLKVDQLTIGLPNGAAIVREVVDKKNVVAILAIMENSNEVILCTQPRVGANELNSIEIPAGLVEDGEDLVEAAKRELLEETGCISDDVSSLGFFYGDPACCNSCTYLFLANNCRKVQEQKLDKDEYLTFFKVEKEEFACMIQNNWIHDANTQIAYYRAVSSGKI